MPGRVQRTFLAELALVVLGAIIACAALASPTSPPISRTLHTAVPAKVAPVYAQSIARR